MRNKSCLRKGTWMQLAAVIEMKAEKPPHCLSNHQTAKVLLINIWGKFIGVFTAQDLTLERGVALCFLPA